MGHGVAHEMDPAALPRGAQHFSDGGLQALVRIGDDQLHAPQAAMAEAAQELDPERLGLAVANAHAQHLAPSVGVDRDGNDDGDRNDVMVAPGADIGGVQPEIGPFALDGACRNICTRSSISLQSRETWLLLIPSMPIDASGIDPCPQGRPAFAGRGARAKSSAERVETPWT